MENNNHMPMQEEEVIDLKELFFYVLRKWKVIVALMLVGALLGGAYAATKSSSSSSESVQTYFISSDFFTTDMIMAKISYLMQDDADLDLLRQEFGIEVGNDALRKMVTVTQSKTATSPTASADTLSGAQVTLTVTHTDSETCMAVAQAIDQQLQNQCDSIVQEGTTCQIEKLSENLATTTTPAPSKVKYAAIGAFILAIIAAMGFAVLYLFNGTVKTVDEVRSLFGLYPIAQLAVEQKKAGKTAAMPVNDYDYLLEALKAMKLDKALICGDTDNAQIAKALEVLAQQDEPYATNPSLALQGQLRAAEAEAVILCIQLWKTPKEALKREVEICQKLDKRIAGVIILK